MPSKSLTVLRTYFETGDRPSQTQFWDMLDSFVHKTSGSVITATSYDETTGQVVINFSGGMDSLVFNVSKSDSEPISFIEGLATALESKVDKDPEKELSSNDFTNEQKTKLDNLTQVSLPTSYEISFINGLVEALDEKANDNEVVKAVNFNTIEYTPDESGIVTIEQENGQSVNEGYNLSGTETSLGFSYFGDEVFGIVLAVPTPQSGSSNYAFQHNLGIDKYLRVEVWESEMSRGATTEPTRKDLVEILADEAGIYNLQDDAVNSAGYTFPASKVLYIEYTKKLAPTEGVGASAVGSTPIGGIVID